jgi:tetratricopeptide (TPR) repeat protein
MIVTLLRSLASLVIAAAALAGTYRFGYLPIKVNYLTGVLRASGKATEEVTHEYTRLIRIRRDLALARELMHQTPERIGPYTVAAANEWLLGHREEALKLYEQTLAYDRRPEILIHMGILHCERGELEEARRRFLPAVLFNPFLRFQIPTTCPVEGVENAAMEHRRMLLER